MASQLDFIINLTDQLTRPLRQVQESVTGFAERSQGAFARIGVGVAGLWGVAEGIRAAMDPAWEMQKALGELEAKGVGAQALTALTTQAMKLGTAFGQSSTEIIRSAWHIRGALDGLSDGDLPRVTAATSTLAVAARVSSEEASGYLAAMGARFRSEFSAMGAVGFAEDLAGKTAWMVQQFGVEMSTMQELIEGTKNAGADFGVSMAEQFAILGTLSRTMGTEASGIYEEFLRSAPAAAQKMGMSFVDVTGRILPMGDILDRLQARFGRNIEGNVAAQQALDDAFGSGADVIKKLWGQQEMLNRSISALGRNDGMKRATEMAEAMTDPWDRLVASFYNIRAAIGNALYPILAPLAGRFADIGATFVRWLNMFPNIARWLGYITLTMLALGAAGAVTNIVLGVFSFIMEGHKAIIKGARAVWSLYTLALTKVRSVIIATSLAARLAGVSFLTMSAPVLLVAAAIAALVVVAIKFWQPVKAFIRGFIDGFTGALDAMSPVTAAFGDIARALTPVWQGIKTLFGAFSDLFAPVQLTTGQMNSVTRAGETCGRVVAAAVSLISPALEVVISVIRTLVDIFAIVIRGWQDVVAAFDPTAPVESFRKMAGIIGNVFGDLWNVIKNSFNRTWNWLAEKLNKIPGISIDMKPTEQVNTMTRGATGSTVPPQIAETAVPALAGNRISAELPPGGIRNQIRTDTSTRIDNSRTFGNLTINTQNPMTPGQLDEWTELYAG
ncbi:phage tail tape measure protein [Escherichia coli]|nr:phage tail tape measure protein [Escherichia coli]EHH6614531.1 phage tail tape measure protein [Escherichia coli]